MRIDWKDEMVSRRRTMAAGDSTPVGTADEGVVIERVFDAPRELVWRAWTEPEHFMRWYGPAGMTSHACEIALQVGGRRLIGMQSPDGQEEFTTGGYRESGRPGRFLRRGVPGAGSPGLLGNCEPHVLTRRQLTPLGPRGPEGSLIERLAQSEDLGVVLLAFERGHRGLGDLAGGLGRPAPARRPDPAAPGHR